MGHPPSRHGEGLYRKNRSVQAVPFSSRRRTLAQNFVLFFHTFLSPVFRPAGRNDARPDTMQLQRIRMQKLRNDMLAFSTRGKSSATGDRNRSAASGSQKRARMTLAINGAIVGRLVAELKWRTTHVTKRTATEKIEYATDNWRRNTAQKRTRVPQVITRSRDLDVRGNAAKMPPVIRRIDAPNQPWVAKKGRCFQ
jgi:hypothetical protein